MKGGGRLGVIFFCGDTYSYFPQNKRNRKIERKKIRFFFFFPPYSRISYHELLNTSEILEEEKILCTSIGLGSGKKYFIGIRQH